MHVLVSELNVVPDAHRTQSQPSLDVAWYDCAIVQSSSLIHAQFQDIVSGIPLKQSYETKEKSLEPVLKFAS